MFRFQKFWQGFEITFVGIQPFRLDFQPAATVSCDTGMRKDYTKNSISLTTKYEANLLSWCNTNIKDILTTNHKQVTHQISNTVCSFKFPSRHIIDVLSAEHMAIIRSSICGNRDARVHRKMFQKTHKLLLNNFIQTQK